MLYAAAYIERQNQDGTAAIEKSRFYNVSGSEIDLKATTEPEARNYPWNLFVFTKFLTSSGKVNWSKYRDYSLLKRESAEVEAWCEVIQSQLSEKLEVGITGEELDAATGYDMSAQGRARYAAFVRALEWKHDVCDVIDPTGAEDPKFWRCDAWLKAIENVPGVQSRLLFLENKLQAILLASEEGLNALQLYGLLREKAGEDTSYVDAGLRIGIRRLSAMNRIVQSSSGFWSVC